ncbi:MAG TPA: SRPBCC family protein [Burkholderiales bacterium]|nr:SRPBCC family protein [Burkholderiales bacterium]
MNRAPDLERANDRALSNGRPGSHWPILSGVGLGAVLMYFLDPNRGRRRRALLRDQIVHVARRLRDARRVTAVDLANRGNGMWAEAIRWFREGDGVSDRELGEQVRAKLGRVVSHPHAIDVTVRDRCVTLSGPILMDEVQPLLSCVQKIAGVRMIEDRLSAYEEAGRISALQGGRPRAGDRFELFQKNWSPTARLLSGIAGAGLVLFGARERGARNLAMTVLGGGLLVRAATNREFASLVGVGENCRGVNVQKTINVNAPVERVFAFWRDYQNFPRFMTNVRDVRVLDEHRSQWIVSGPAGVPIDWISEVTRIVPNRRIEWRSEPGSPVHHIGAVHFDPNGNGGTRLDIQLCYVPPAGALGHAVAKVFGSDPKSEMDADLMRMKTMIESGHRPHDAAQPVRPVGATVPASALE